MRNAEWEVNELLPVADSFKIITIGTCYKPGQMGISPLITIDTKFGSPQVAHCITCERLDEPPKEAIRIFEVSGYDFRIAPNDRAGLIMRTPAGGFYLFRKKMDSDLKIAWMQIHDKRTDPEEDEDQGDIPPSRLDWN